MRLSVKQKINRGMVYYVDPLTYQRMIEEVKYQVPRKLSYTIAEAIKGEIRESTPEEEIEFLQGCKEFRLSVHVFTEEQMNRMMHFAHFLPCEQHEAFVKLINEIPKEYEDLVQKQD